MTSTSPSGKRLSSKNLENYFTIASSERETDLFLDPDIVDMSSGRVRKDVGIEMNKILSGEISISSKTSKIIIQQDHEAFEIENWNYPGWGGILEKTITSTEMIQLSKKSTLDSFRSTAISGNDLMASVLYTTGVVCVASGQLAPIVMLLCVFALYPFVTIFQECGTALPLNGGIYTTLLNSSNKFFATFAAACCLIDYAATAVVSAASCTSYASKGFGDFPIIPVTILIFACFGGLVLCGVKESANFATAIFAFHIITLIIIVITSLKFIIENNGEILHENWIAPLPSNQGSNIAMNLYLGFSVGLLGLTGFETSASYIEEAGPFETDSNKIGSVRRKSVFERTMSNMWYLVLIFNPLIALLTIGVVPMSEITSNTSTILSIVGKYAGGRWLEVLVNIDAIVVLSGGVLTAYVGVVGLIKQLAADRCLPHFLLNENKLFKTHHWIILSFFLLCVTLYLIANGDVTILAGVFSLAFLMVLILFAWGNICLKYARPRLPRGVSCSWMNAISGLLVMIVGLIGNIIFNPEILKFFVIYIIFFFILIFINSRRLWIAKMMLYFVRHVPVLEEQFGDSIVQTLVSMKQFTVLFFTKSSELHILNKAILYARDNECIDRLIIAHVHPIRSSSSMNESPETSSKESQLGDSRVIRRLKENLKLLDHMYPKMKIDLLIVYAEGFTPQVVASLSHSLNISPSFMFIRCPGKNFPYNIGEFEGIRTIMK